MTKKVLAIIPARGGSKLLPRKNLKQLGGKPLIVWTIEAALKSRYITKIVVSTDDDEISNLSKKSGVSVIKRPKNLASDTSTSESVILHTLDFLNSDDLVFDIVILLQPTSPFRSTLDIDNAYEMMINSRAKSLISVNQTDNKFLKSFIKTPLGYLEGVSKGKYAFMRRQDLPVIFLSNGAIYIIYVNDFLKTKSLFTDKTIEFIMNKEHSIDIDSHDDIATAELMLNNSRNKI
jgi:CMP-N-acetylneuraminic acid synthetase